VGQISRPLQIVLAATVLMFMLWFFALRPKPEPAAPPATPVAGSPAASGKADSALPGSLGNAVDKANDAAATSDQANARAGADQPSSDKPAVKKLPASVGGVAAVGAEQASALLVRVKAKDLSKPLKATLPADVQRALDKGKVLVLLFWNGKSSDDRAVRASVKSLSTHGGKVFKDVSRLASIGRYSAVTNGVPVLGSPTVIVVGKKKSAVSFTGFVDTTNINQAVLAALG